MRDDDRHHRRCDTRKQSCKDIHLTRRAFRNAEIGGIAMGRNSLLIRAKLTTVSEMIDRHVEIGQELFLETVSGIISSPVTARGNRTGKRKDCYSYRS